MKLRKLGGDLGGGRFGGDGGGGKFSGGDCSGGGKTLSNGHEHWRNL